MKEIDFEKLNLTYPKPILIKDLDYLYPKEDSKQKRRYGIYKCGFCGNEFKSISYLIKSGHTKSCGCHNKRRTKEVNTKHGLRSTRLYNIWSKLKGRVLNPKNKKHNDYVGDTFTLGRIKVVRRYYARYNTSRVMDEDKYLKSYRNHLMNLISELVVALFHSARN
jgi:transcription elongation factor Elf1